MSFKPRARLLLLLGDQLIRDPGVAVFELVKNAYDADSAGVDVTMTNLTDPERAKIVVQDRGLGMTWETVTGVWLEPGTDYRAEQRRLGERTPIYHRLPMGEKGVGRFAAHKLGHSVRLVTRAAGCEEVVVEIDWRQFESSRYLEDAKVVSVKERPPLLFRGAKTGTRIEVSHLRHAWTRGMVRDLYRAVMAICSPFDGPDSFKTSLSVEPAEWVEGLLNSGRYMELAMFRASCTIEGNQLTYEYTFVPLPGMHQVEGRHVRRELTLGIDLDRSSEDGSPMAIGPVRIDFQVFDLDPQVLAYGVSDRKGLREFLKENGGIRVYRDGIRVYDYGEPGNDWLDLGTRRVNTPTARISNNIVVGAASISLEDSQDLVEKTNREGFVENEASAAFRRAVLEALKHVEAERYQDKLRIRRVYSKARSKEPVLAELATLRKALKNHGLEDELGPYLQRVEKQFIEVRDQLLAAAGAGLSMAVVIHEVEKAIGELSKALERDAPVDRLRALASHLTELIDGLTYLTRKSGSQKESAVTLIKNALFNTEYRNRYHHIEVVNGIDLYQAPDFKVKCTRRLIISTLMNLIDNAIYWLDVKGSKDKRIYVGTTFDISGQPALVVADNGPGFVDPPEYLLQPFFTRKPDGMGLGLHLASMVMETHDQGFVAFPDASDINVPPEFTGAIIALVFGGKSWTR